MFALEALEQVSFKDLLRLIEHLGVVTDQELVELVASLGAHEHGLAVDLREEGEHAGFEAEDYRDEVERAAEQEDNEHRGDAHIVLVEVDRVVNLGDNEVLRCVQEGPELGFQVLLCIDQDEEEGLIRGAYFHCRGGIQMEESPYI